MHEGEMLPRDGATSYCFETQSVNTSLAERQYLFRGTAEKRTYSPGLSSWRALRRSRHDLAMKGHRTLAGGCSRKGSCPNAPLGLVGCKDSYGSSQRHSHCGNVGRLHRAGAAGVGPIDARYEMMMAK